MLGRPVPQLNATTLRFKPLGLHTKSIPKAGIGTTGHGMT